MKAQDLKKSILQYAMQGKLVPQDQQEEPASELLKKIITKTLKLGADETYPYELPQNWEWIRLSALCSLDIGEKVSNVSLPLLNAKYLRKKTDKTLVNTGFFVKQNDIMILVDGENSGEIFTVPEDGIMGSTFKQLSINPFVNSDFVLWILAFYQDLFRNSKKGAAIPHLDKTLFKNLIIGLPPLNEQKRIVEKFEQILPSIDEYNKNEQKLTEINEKLPNKLRQSILQYAVQGKLVLQDKNDEPASKLLKKIKVKKESLSPITDREKPYNLPHGWAWCRIKDIGELNRGKSKHRPRNAPELFGGKYPFVQTGDIARAKLYVKNHSQTYSEMGLAQSRLFPQNTLCITIAANIGDTAILSYPACFPDSVVGFIPYANMSEVLFVYYFINIMKTNLEKYAPATAQKNINLATLDKLVFPLPPIEEQKRIVAKVEELMKLCDELEEQIKNPKLAVKVLEKITEALPAVKKSNVIDISDAINKRAVYNAYLISKFRNDKYFGAIKKEKLNYVPEKVLDLPIGGDYSQDAAGPLDIEARNKVEKIFKELKWINVIDGNKSQNTRYIPDKNFAEHEELFDLCFEDKKTEIDNLLNLFKNKTSEECEAVATLYAVWSDLLIDKMPASQDDIIEGFYKWSEKKKNFNRQDLYETLIWMKMHNIVPAGKGKKTIPKSKQMTLI